MAKPRLQNVELTKEGIDGLAHKLNEMLAEKNYFPNANYVFEYGETHSINTHPGLVSTPVNVYVSYPGEKIIESLVHFFGGRTPVYTLDLVAPDEDTGATFRKANQPKLYLRIDEHTDKYYPAIKAQFAEFAKGYKNLLLG
ncbi:MAG: hypothetical protein NDI94_02460 [Candidatus Woesearchaeota archaeon]|nr:hypothetical protein [Candidatus Woesearchaeota archaeon]